MTPKKPTQSRTPKGRKLPKAFIECRPFGAYSTTTAEEYVLACIPCRTKREAAQVVRIMGHRNPEALQELISEALAWWEDRRPCVWTADAHAKTPAVNCCTESEKRLAEAVRNITLPTHD